MGLTQGSDRTIIARVSTDQPHIVFAEPFQETYVDRARKIGRVTTLPHCDEARLLDAVSDCSALLVRTSSRVTAKVLNAAPRLRVIGRGGTGVDNIDLEAAKQRGVIVVHTPAAATHAAADLTVGLILNLVRKIGLGDSFVRAGKFAEGRNECVGTELNQLTLGIIGMGRIGQAVARRCQAGFGMSVLYNDIVDVDPSGVSATPVSKEYLYKNADVITLHVPLTEQTNGIIDADVLAQMNPTSHLVNASRGAVVDGFALAAALREHRLAGAALDVFDPEPLPTGHPLLTAPNTILTPHIGARTIGALDRMNAVVDDVLGVLQGQPAQFPAG